MSSDHPETTKLLEKDKFRKWGATTEKLVSGTVNNMPFN